MLGKISPSSLNSFDSCSLSWLYRKLKRQGIEVDDTPARLGLNVHHMIHVYFDEVPENPNEKNIVSLAEKIFTDLFDKSLSHVKDKGHRCWKNFLSFERDRLHHWPAYKPTDTETTFENSDFLCIVDFFSDDCGVALDWKTGSLDRLWDDQLRQGKINLMCLEDNGHPITKFFFVGLDNNRVLEMPSVSRAWVEDDAAKMRRMVAQGKFPKRKSKLCDYCEFQLDCQFSDVCLWMAI